MSRSNDSINDIYRRHLVRRASERHYMIAGRASVFLILGLALLVVYKVSFVFDVAVFMVGLSAAEMSANWAQWWWWRFNGWGRVAASFGGGLFYVCIALLWPGLAWWNRMFLSIAVSTSLWIIATVLTAPERNQLLVAFYRRAQPLGSWKPIQRLAGDLPSAAHGVRPIVKGIIIALCGAASVMAWIVGITYLYIGGYARGAVLLAVAVGLGVAFWKTFPNFIDALQTAQERAGGDRAEVDMGHGDPFGLTTVFSLVCFATAALTAVEWTFLGGGNSSVVVAAVALLAGVGLLYWRRTAQRNAPELD